MMKLCLKIEAINLGLCFISNGSNGLFSYEFVNLGLCFIPNGSKCVYGVFATTVFEIIFFG